MGIYEEAQRALAERDAKEEAKLAQERQLAQALLEFSSAFVEAAIGSNLPQTTIGWVTHRAEETGFFRTRTEHLWSFHSLFVGWHLEIVDTGYGVSHLHTIVILPDARMLYSKYPTKPDWSPAERFGDSHRLLDVPDGNFSVMDPPYSFRRNSDYRTQPKPPEPLEYWDYHMNKAKLLEWLGDVINGTHNQPLT